MEHLLQFGLSNALAAAVLAVLAAVATRVWRNPHFAYALWFVVLLRLVAPPLLPVAVPVPEWMAGNSRDADPPSRGVDPRGRPVGLTHGLGVEDLSSLDTPPQGRSDLPAKRDSGAPSLLPERFRTLAHVSKDRGDPEGTPPSGSSGMSRGVSKDVSPSSTTRRPSIANLVAAVWLSGTFCYLLLTTLRVRRFARVLSRARRDVPAGIAAEAADVAAAVGLRRVPRLAFARAALPPMVWPGWRPVVLLPEALFTSLGAGEQRLLLWHEFLHLRRRDHLVRWFEVGVVALYWWNPVAWWAVARLQRAEEDCCDAAILVAHPHESARYGETLVSVAQFLSAGTLPTPSLSVGVARNGHIKRRLTMILHGPRWPELSKTRLAAFSLLGAALVAVTWTAAKAQTAPAAPAASAASPSSAASVSPTSPPQQEGERIDEILVEGNVTIPAAAILQKMKIRAGHKATPSMVQEDLRTLIKTRWFFSVVPKYRRTDKKLILVLSVVERPMIHSVTYLGATQIKLKKLAAETGLKIGGPYDMGANKEAARHLENFYHEQGYTEATVDLIKGDKPEDRDVVFRIHEGVSQKLVYRYFVGNDSVSGERLCMELKSTPAYVINGKFDPVNLTEDVAAVRKYYADLGFFDATVTPKVEYRHNREWIYLKYTVHEGLHYKIRDFSVTGNVRLKTDELLKTIKTHEGQYYNAFQIKQDLAAIKKKYDALGYKSVNVEIVPRFVKQPGVIDLLLRVELAQNEQQRNQPRSQPPQTPHTALPQLPNAGRARSDIEPRATSPVTTTNSGSTRPRPTAGASAMERHEDVFTAKPAGLPKSVPALLYPRRLEPAAGDDELRELLKEKYNAAARAMQVYQMQFRSGNLDLAARIGDLLAAGRNLRDAELALVEKPQNQLGILETYLEFTQYLEKAAEGWLKAGGVAGVDAPLEAARMREARVDAQLRLLELRRALNRNESQNTPAEAKAAPTSPAPSGPALPRLLTSKPVQIAPGDDDRQKLLKARYNAALRSLKASYDRRTQIGFISVTAAARQLLAADVALQKSEDTVRVYERYLELMKFLEKEIEPFWQARTIGRDEFEAAQEARLDAEIKLLDAKQKLADHDQSRIQSTDAAVVAAKAELDAAKATVEQRKAELKRQTAYLAYRTIQYERISHLYEQRAIEARLVTEQRDKRDAASAAVAKAKEALEAAESQLLVKQVQFDQLAKLSQTK